MADNEYPVYDVAVIGGGIHGVAMAAEAASRNLKTVLFQAKDIASGTSSPIESTANNLRKFEQFKFGQLSTNMRELALLRKKAPHIARVQASYILSDNKIRSDKWVSNGTSFYKRWQKHHVENHGNIKFSSETLPALENSSETIMGEFINTNLNSNRLIISTAKQAEQLGCELYFYHELVKATRLEQHWILEVKNNYTNETREYKSKILINCCGWGVDQVLGKTLGVISRCKSSYSLAGYIFASYHFPSDQSLVCQLSDKRFLTITPFGRRHICLLPAIATSDSEADKESAIKTTLDIANKYLQKPIEENDIRFIKWKKIPSLDVEGLEFDQDLDNALLDLNNPGKLAPCLSLYGNSLFQYRKLATQGLNVLEVFTNAGNTNTLENQTLPGGDIPNLDLDGYIDKLSKDYSFIPSNVIARYVRTYGSLTCDILKKCHTEADLGRDFGEGLYEVEVKHLIDEEWVTNADDILWRRTFLGLLYSAEQVQELDKYINLIKNQAEN